MKRIVVLGSTGSVGRNVLEVVSQHADRFEIVGLAARSSHEEITRQCDANAEAVFVLTSPPGLDEMTRARPDLASRAVGSGENALDDLIRATKPDLVVNALVGFVGLAPTMTALLAGIPVAIANKETIVTGGKILLEAARNGGTRLIPIDSEHVAISQCLGSEPPGSVEKVIMTASGGALRDRPLDTMPEVTIDDVLAHPTWNMGKKITVDSATLLNKGLEIIEAHWLFDLPYDRIEVVIHPQSIVHSFVEFIDGSIVAQMGKPDMRQPILYALSYPERYRSTLGSNILEFPRLEFDEVDMARYPCFEHALAAARAGGNAPTILNAANEVAVGWFLAGEISFLRIADIVGAALDGLPGAPVESLDDIIKADAATREWILKRFSIETNN